MTSQLPMVNFAFRVLPTRYGTWAGTLQVPDCTWGFEASHHILIRRLIEIGVPETEVSSLTIIWVKAE